MQALFDTTRMFPESWISPGDIGAFYRGMMDALFANNSVTQALGDLALVVGVAGIMALPLIWYVHRLLKRSPC